MPNIKKKITVENILCLFIVLCPILDMISFLFRNFFNTSISPSTFIRPIIPITLIMYIFIKDKIKLKLVLVAIIYAVYALIHIYIFNILKTEISYGTVMHELQYIINYSFMILNLFIYLYFFYRNDNNIEKIKKSTLISMCIYIVSIYLSIFTNTTSSTYIEQIGVKGWFESGNSVSAILILGVLVLYTMVKNIKYNKIAIAVILFSGVYLMTMIGTRVGLYGFIIVTLVYIFSEITVKIKNKMHISKKVLAIVISIIVVLIGIITVKGSNTLERRKFLKNQQSDLIDISTGQPAHVTLDIVDIKEKIIQGNMPKEVMSLEEQKSIIQLYEYANKHNISGTDRRMQQLVYNYYKIINQKDIKTILFGNGYLNNYAELTLEMEIPAFLLNYGICGLILFFMPFLAIALYCTYIGIKNIKQIDAEYLTLLIGVYFTFVISLLTGCVFFNSSTTVIIIIINTLLLNKVYDIKTKKILR